MKKELRIFLIILLGWLLLLNFAILKTVITKYITYNKAVIIKNLINGAVVFQDVSSSTSLFRVVILPLIIFNTLVILFLSLSYYFYKKKILKFKRSKIDLRKKGVAIT